MWLNGQPCGYDPTMPSYDRERWELSVGDDMVLGYHRVAWNQMAVLEMFQKLGWPRTIKDPLVGKRNDPTYAARLRKTIFRLNARHTLIRFHGHALAQTISWEWEIPLKGS